LNELKGKPDGYGIKHLIGLARENPNWGDPLELDERARGLVYPPVQCSGNGQNGCLVTLDLNEEIESQG
jgi:hypothetical protein